jgi:hypothetical protein
MNKTQQKHLILLVIVGLAIWKRNEIHSEISKLFGKKEAYGCKKCA